MNTLLNYYQNHIPDNEIEYSIKERAKNYLFCAKTSRDIDEIKRLIVLVQRLLSGLERGESIVTGKVLKGYIQEAFKN